MEHMAAAAGVHVTVVADNVPAIGFYRRLGFATLEVADPGPVVYLGRRLYRPGSGRQAAHGGAS